MKLDNPYRWLQESAIPLWFSKGVDRSSGAFVEALSASGEALAIDRRAMVQARQIYSCRVAIQMGIFPQIAGLELIEMAAKNLIQKYSTPGGAFIRSLTPDGQPADDSLDLYTQAFALFGLAHAYAAQPEIKFKEQAKKLLHYLSKNRKLSEGGYSELDKGKICFEANPHMHLFEAALAWMEVDNDPVWSTLADEILELCLHQFIDAKSGFLSEHFVEGWKPLLIGKRFVVEPGHQFEWAWLLARYEKMRNRDLLAVRTSLFQSSEKFGINQKYNLVFDEIWSDGSVKKQSSRFWTQCERIKCAVVMGNRKASEEAMTGLLRFFQTPQPGLWYDQMNAEGEFKQENSKASSLYHIIAAIQEFEKQ